MKRLIIIAVVLVALIALPVYAQQSGLTLEGLSSRIDVLFSGQQYLTNRIAALETAVAISSQQQAVVVVTATPIPSTPLPTATQRLPTPSYTPQPTRTPIPTPTASPAPSVTSTPTPASAMITTDRRLSLRRGPGNNHSIVVYVAADSQLEVTGKNVAGSWVQVNYDGEVGWLPARYANDLNSIPIVATPTPLPKRTAAPTLTPVPTATMESLSQVEWDYMIGFAKRDTIGMGRNPVHYTDRQYEEWTGMLTAKLREAAENCDMGLMELAEVIDSEALLLEETGIPERLDAAARWDFLRTLTEWWDETVETSCKRKIVGRRLWIVANYGDDE